MSAAILFVHSPLLGPSSWARVAQLVRGKGIPADVPDLTEVADQVCLSRAFVTRAARAGATLPGPVVVAGHSGAGALLPAIGRSVGDRLAGLLFVDAVIPPQRGAHRTPRQMMRLVDDQTVDGRLLPWLDWWSAQQVQALLPDPADRDLVRSDMPRLPRCFYDEEVPVPPGWSQWPCAFVKLSEAYEAEWQEAGRRGWVRVGVHGHHLLPVTAPAMVLTAMDAAVSCLEEPVI